MAQEGHLSVQSPGPKTPEWRGAPEGSTASGSGRFLEALGSHWGPWRYPIIDGSESIGHRARVGTAEERDGAHLIYGANGYTGELTAREAHRRGQKPILAGRREEPVRALAEELGLEWRVASLDRSEERGSALDGVDAVLHCAGPFSATSRPMDACLRTKTHYLDITGEMGVFQRSSPERGGQGGGGGSDSRGRLMSCRPIAWLRCSTKNYPKQRISNWPLPVSGASAGGTLKTSVEGMQGVDSSEPQAGPHPLGQSHASPPVFPKVAPWDGDSLGDVYTAHKTTSPNITVYTVPPSTAAWPGAPRVSETDCCPVDPEPIKGGSIAGCPDRTRI